MEFIELAPGLGQAGLDALQLALQQIFIVGDHNSALQAKDLLAGAIGQATGQAWAGQGRELFQRNAQQIRMLGRHQGADEVKGRRFQRLECLFGIVAFVEDQRDALAPLSQLAVTLGQFLRNALKGGGVGQIAGIEQVKERHVEIGAHEHAQADLPQVAAMLLVVTAGRQPGRGAGIDKGEEVGAVIHQRAQGEVQLLHQPLRERLLDGLDVGLGDAFHVVPEGLAGELVGRGGQQAGLDGGRYQSATWGLLVG